jgi:acyl carrier protein
LVDDLGFDSLTMVETALEIDEEFDVSVPDEMMETVRTVGDIVDGILQLPHVSEGAIPGRRDVP